MRSPLAWGRGLKHISVGTGIICTGLPRAGAWIETLVTSLFGENTRVASRVGRGLKRIRRRVIRIRRPQRGAWIETCVIRNFVPPKFRKVKQPGKGKVKQPTKYTIT